jgi:hypothetical protein
MAEKKLMRGPKVVKTASGSVTWLDRLQNYWKFAIAAGGAILVALNDLTPVFNFIPASQPTVSTVIAVVTAALTWLKANEQWINEL